MTRFICHFNIRAHHSQSAQLRVEIEAEDNEAASIAANSYAEIVLRGFAWFIYAEAVE